MPLGAPDLCYAGTPTPAVSSSRCQISPPPPPHLHLLTTSTSTLNHLCSPPMGHSLPQFSGVASARLSASHSASQVLPVILFYPRQQRVNSSQFILSPLLNRAYLLRLSDIISAWGSLPALHSSEFIEGFCGHPSISIHPFSHHFVLISMCSPHHHSVSGKRPQLQSHVCLSGQRGLVFSSHKADCQKGKTGIKYSKLLNRLST